MLMYTRAARSYTASTIINVRRYEISFEQELQHVLLSQRSEEAKQLQAPIITQHQVMGGELSGGNVLVKLTGGNVRFPDFVPYNTLIRLDVG